jgi:hypothetical protein
MEKVADFAKNSTFGICFEEKNSRFILRQMQDYQIFISRRRRDELEQ